MSSSNSATDPDPDATQLEVVFVNKTYQSMGVCLYQTYSGMDDFNVLSVAWFIGRADGRQPAVFRWQPDFYFVWAQTGRLGTGVVFQPGQTLYTDLSSNNEVTFTYPGGNFAFWNQQQGPLQGSLLITLDGTIPLNLGAVGTGMAGAATLVMQAQPFMNYVFTPQPEYWIAIGDYVQGEVLDISSMNATQIAFPAGVSSMTATLNPDGSWTVEPTAPASE